MANSRVSDWLEADKLTLLSAWARDGLTDLQIANKMGISSSTFYDWKRKNLEISEAIKKGKEVVDYEVENALLKRALGFKESLLKQKVTRDGDVVDTTEEVYFPPDVGAAMAWLKNRKPDKWRDKPQEKDGNEQDRKVIIVDDLPEYTE